MAEEGDQRFPCPSNTAVLRSQHLEYQQHRLQRDRKISTGAKRQLGGTEGCVCELGEMKWAAQAWSGGSPLVEKQKEERERLWEVYLDMREPVRTTDQGDVQRASVSTLQNSLRS